MVSKWESLKVGDTVIGLLHELSQGQPHHFGPPFVSAYQLAIALAEKCPDIAAGIGFPVGGAGTHEHNSLAQYLAHELSTRIKKGKITTIEGAWLSREYLPELDFIDDEDEKRTASTNPRGLSMFRLKPSKND